MHVILTLSLILNHARHIRKVTPRVAIELPKVIRQALPDTSATLERQGNDSKRSQGKNIMSQWHTAGITPSGALTQWRYGVAASGEASVVWRARTFASYDDALTALFAARDGEGEEAS